jgi:2-polyprenyl-3-methyl-5-hydroxy-6-metoxy-1,4-benzoquinol methylase
MSRKVLDVIFGLYSKRINIIREFGIDTSVSVLDIGCGTGQYSQITDFEYLGLDMDCHYIDSARKIYGDGKKKFKCSRLQEVDFEGRKYDVSLLIDLTHHISNEDARKLLALLSSVTKHYLIVCDPVKQNRRNYIGAFITYLDRGQHIRDKQDELDLIEKYFEIIKTYDLKMLGVENIVVIAKPK